MIVQDGLIDCVLVVELAGSLSGEQKVVVDESHVSSCARGGACQAEVQAVAATTAAVLLTS